MESNILQKEYSNILFLSGTEILHLSLLFNFLDCSTKENCKIKCDTQTYLDLCFYYIFMT